MLWLTGSKELGNNFFAYCYNNPVIGVDPKGRFISDFFGSAGLLLEIAVTFVAIEIDRHYFRNQYNKPLPSTMRCAELWGWDGTVSAACHKFTSLDNVKYVSWDGYREAVYNKKTGKIVTNHMDMGTYNFWPSTKGWAEHFAYDIFPWILWGNSIWDLTTSSSRVAACAYLFELLSIIFYQYDVGVIC